MDIPIYTPGELVRIELLNYENPEGLHPVESDWRDLSRKLLGHVKELQLILEEIKEKPHSAQYNSNLKEWRTIKFPEAFKPIQQ